MFLIIFLKNKTKSFTVVGFAVKIALLHNTGISKYLATTSLLFPLVSVPQKKHYTSLITDHSLSVQIFAGYMAKQKPGVTQPCQSLPLKGDSILS